MIANSLSQSILSVILLIISLFCRVIVDPCIFVVFSISSLFRVSLKKFYANKTVLITGASSGIGEALAIKAAKLGANVILAGRNRERLCLVASACKEVALHPGSQVFHTWIIDLEKVDQLEASYRSLEDDILKATDATDSTVKGIDILINNAGVSTRGSVLDLQAATLDKVMNTNFVGPVVLSQLVAKDMIGKGIKGSIIVNSSVQGKLAIPNRAAYAASKHALQGYFDSFRLEMEQHGVHTMVVSPGYVSTKLSLNAVCGNGAPHNKMDDNTKNGMSPDDLADRIFSLAINNSNKDIIIADHKTNAAILCRALLPGFLWKFLKNKQT